MLEHDIIGLDVTSGCSSRPMSQLARQAIVLIAVDKHPYSWNKN